MREETVSRAQPVALKFRPHFAPQILLGFLLFWLGFGAILLVLDSLSSRSAPTGIGEILVAGVVLVLGARIWRTSEGARWMAGVFAVFWYSRLWRSMLPETWDVPWFTPVHALALIAISVGLWRAQPWARWVAGLATILSSIMFVLLLLGVYPAAGNPLPLLSEPGILGIALALFWGATALWLFLPSTGERFARLRAAREPSDDRSV
jgi:hypothetical protein